MPRKLGSDLCELKIHDNISNSEIVFYYRMPTTQERMAYSNESFQRKRNRLVNRLTETRQKFGARILQGIRDGDFEKKMGTGYAPIASDPKSPRFDPDWREHIEKYAADLIELLAAHIFDAPAETIDEDDNLEEDITKISTSDQEDIEKN